MACLLANPVFLGEPVGALLGVHGVHGVHGVQARLFRFLPRKGRRWLAWSASKAPTGSVFYMGVEEPSVLQTMKLLV